LSNNNWNITSSSRWSSDTAARPGSAVVGACGFCHSLLDELPEFAQKTLEVMRQPLEDKVVTIARAKGALTFPANFMLVGALNPCPCSYWGDPTADA
jgi:magnesium chelatase family protein